LVAWPGLILEMEGMFSTQGINSFIDNLITVRVYIRKLVNSYYLTVVGEAHGAED